MGDFFSQDVVGLGLQPLQDGPSGPVYDEAALADALAELALTLHASRLAVFSSGNAEPMVSPLRNSLGPEMVWAWYGDHHAQYDAFHRSLWNLPLDDSLEPLRILLLLCPIHEALLRLRELKTVHPTVARIVIPFLPQGLYDSRALEDPAPVLFWATQYSGTMRALPVMSRIFNHFGRIQAHTRPFWYSPRYLRTHGVFAPRTLEERDSPEARCLWHAPYGAAVGPEACTEAFASQLEVLPDYYWLLCHEFVDLERILRIPEMKVVTLVRDPRDILNSMSFRMLSDPRMLPEDHPYAFLRRTLAAAIAGTEMATLREQILHRLLDGGVFERRLNQMTCFPPLRRLCESFLAAQRSDRAYCLRFEDLRKDPGPAYRDLLDWMRLRPHIEPMGDAALAEAIHHGTFEAQGMAGPDGSGSVPTHTVFDPATGLPRAARAGQEGGWRETFPPSVIARIDEECGELIEELGYGRSPAPHSVP